MDIKLISHLKQALENHTDAPRNYIGASGIGNPCERKIWYSYKGLAGKDKPELKLTFEIGKRLEAMILDIFEKTPIQVIRPSEENCDLFCVDKDLPSFSGHMDAILVLESGERIILDIKTAKASSYAKFVNQGLKAWNMQYYAQLQAYMGMTGLNRAILLAINKDSSEMHEEWVWFNDIYYQELKMKAARIIDCEVEPARINKSPLFYLCRMCSYSEKCHG